MSSTVTGTAMRWLRTQIAQVRTPPPAREGAGAADQGSGQPDVSALAPGGEQFRQPDQTTCGSSSLVMAKMINTPGYGAAMLAPGHDGSTDPVVVTKRFDQAVLAMHRVTGGWKDSGGTWQLPWPTQLGTPPWAAARQMSVASRFSPNFAIKGSSTGCAAVTTERSGCAGFRCDPNAKAVACLPSSALRRT